MIIHYVLQRSQEWYAVKCGKIGASSIKDVLSKGTTRNTYMMRLLAERLSGIPQETYCNGAMQWGIDNEEFARNTYEMETGNTVQQVGFVELDEFIGCSPDGLVGGDGLVEIKCPNSSTHLTYILAGKMPAEYVLQVQTQLWITERLWCDFVSFDPRIPSRPFWTIRVNRDEKKITEINSGVKVFLTELLDLEREVKYENE